MPLPTPQIDLSVPGFAIGGEYVDAQEGGRFATVNPSNGEHLADVPLATAADVDRAVAAAELGFREWSRVSLKERALCLELLARRIEEKAEDLALLDSVDAGNALSGMRGDMDWTTDTLRYFAGLVTEIKGESSSHGPNHLNFTRRQPYGVVARIVAFNHPFRFCIEKIAAPLAAGNAVVVKGSEQAPISSLRIGELVDGIFPPGVVNVIAGAAEAGAALVTHPGVSRIGFVGSVPTGRAIAVAAAESLKVVSLELGGKNPIIIFPDADPDQAATAAIKGMNMNRQGQSCSSTSRVFVHGSLHEPVAAELARQAEALPVGAPWYDDSEVGPVVSERQYDRVMDFIASGRDEGAELLAGGGPPDDADLAAGYFIKPTVFDHVTPEMRIGSEEIFGPVMSIMPWDNEDAMLEAVNGVEYGLTAAIVTKDLAQAMQTAEQVDAGYVWVNTGSRYLGAPYGGWKQSGLGQEECLEELLSYTRIKNVNMRW